MDGTTSMWARAKRCMSKRKKSQRHLMHDESCACHAKARHSTRRGASAKTHMHEAVKRMEGEGPSDEPGPLACARLSPVPWYAVLRHSRRLPRLSTCSVSLLRNVHKASAHRLCAASPQAQVATLTMWARRSALMRRHMPILCALCCNHARWWRGIAMGARSSLAPWRLLRLQVLGRTGRLRRRRRRHVRSAQH